MKSHARVVVIGGGVVGVSTLYQLKKKGWSDVVLLERTELTSGSTWHAAGLLPLFNMSYTVGQLHKYSVDLYKRLPAETGQDAEELIEDVWAHGEEESLREDLRLKLALDRLASEVKRVPVEPTTEEEAAPKIWTPDAEAEENDAPEKRLWTPGSKEDA